MEVRLDRPGHEKKSKLFSAVLSTLLEGYMGFPAAGIPKVLSAESFIQEISLGN